MVIIKDAINAGARTDNQSSVLEYDQFVFTTSNTRRKWLKVMAYISTSSRTGSPGLPSSNSDVFWTN